MQTSTESITQVLVDLRDAIDHNRFIPINRLKNQNSLARLGLTWEDAKEELYGLSVSDYIAGPCLDRDRPASDRFWVFKRRILGETIYIKFKILYQEDGSVKLVSFHIDEQDCF